MSRLPAVKRARRSATQWRELLSRFESSGLAVAAFCRRESLSTASFYQWRTRLGGARRLVSLREAPAADFVDLGGLAASGGFGGGAGGVELHLDLGGGLSLHLVRR